MAEAVLNRIHSDIRARLRELQPAVIEYEQLQAADEALADLAADPSGARGVAPASLAAPSRRRAPRQQRSSAPRAPRGANRAAVLRVLEERPGVSVAELASASGVGRTVLYGLLRRLEQRGEVAKEQLPGASTGYRLAPPAAAATAPDATPERFTGEPD